MKNLPKYAVLAIFFTFVGAVVTFIGMMAFDNKKTQTTPNKNTIAQQPSMNTNTLPKDKPKKQPITASASKDSTTINVAPKIQKQTVQSKKTAPVDSEHILQLKKGSPVLAYDFINSHQAMLELVPIYNNNNEIDKVAVYRFDEANTKSLETLFPLANVSTRFPPLSVNDATQKIETYRPNSYPQYQGKLVVLSGGDTPFYHFLANDGQGNQQALLVDAYSGFVQKMTAKDIEAEKKFSETNVDEMLSVNHEGLLELNTDVAENLSPIEQEFMKEQQKVMNDMIKQGAIKLDDQGNMIENNMTEAQFDAMDKRMRELEKKLMQPEEP